jgi:hypothetical protein
VSRSHRCCSFLAFSTQRKPRAAGIAEASITTLTPVQASRSPATRTIVAVSRIPQHPPTRINRNRPISAIPAYLGCLCVKACQPPTSTSAARSAPYRPVLRHPVASLASRPSADAPAPVRPNATVADFGIACAEWYASKHSLAFSGNREWYTSRVHVALRQYQIRPESTAPFGYNPARLATAVLNFGVFEQEWYTSRVHLRPPVTKFPPARGERLGSGRARWGGGLIVRVANITCLGYPGNA